MAQTCLYIVGFPLLAFIVQVSVGKRLPRQGDWVSVLAIAASFVLSVPIFLRLAGSGFVFDSLSTTWISLPGPGSFELTRGAFSIVVGVVVNNLTAIMLLMVSLCSMLIHIFSIGYMHGESRYHLFFAYISLFSAAMLGLVVSDNLLTFFICWELMGLCSYLLIGFYYQKPSAIHASLKAFMTTRIGDVALFLGILAVYYVFGTSNFEKIYAGLGFSALDGQTLLGLPVLTFIGLMVLMGAIGKSAQFPLHVWLPDAMEGPTPVSALIHAATMVAAGVFLLIRMFPLLVVSHGVLEVVAYVGAITAFFAALLAVVQVDIKKVLAYSTISQLGFMVMGVGVGAFAAAFLHLITHAFFKACLFLCSGSVIHAVHTQDMREMGGLKAKMPWTFGAMLIATAALSGLPFFSGFVSKDRILAGVLAHSFARGTWGTWIIVVMGFSAAALTAFYMFRLIYMTFFGPAKDEHKFHHADESPWVMVGPLVGLALFSFAVWFAGPTGIGTLDQIFPVHWYDRAVESVQQHWGILQHGNAEMHHRAHTLSLVLSLCVAFGGILLSTLVYLKKLISADSLKRMFGPAYDVLWNLYYFDTFYNGILIQKGLLNWNRFLAVFDDRVVDRIFVDGWSRVTLVVKSIVGKFDDLFVDQIMVDGTGVVTSAGGWVLRRFQTGRVQQYLILCFIVFVILLFYLRGTHA